MILVRRAWTLAIFSCALIALDTAARADPSDSPDKTPKGYDCGTLALYHLLHLEGRPTELQAIESRLPSVPPGGYSLWDLSLAARASGVKLIGLRLKNDDSAIDRPMLVFVKRGEHGHFLVIRPVGHTGKLVQTLDGFRTPEILDKSSL